MLVHSGVYGLVEMVIFVSVLTVGLEKLQRIGGVRHGKQIRETT
jgi:NADH:ubiquinone oxidoreductase subunit 3 (subunit A)